MVVTFTFVGPAVVIIASSVSGAIGIYIRTLFGTDISGSGGTEYDMETPEGLDTLVGVFCANIKDGIATKKIKIALHLPKFVEFMELCLLRSEYYLILNLLTD